MKKININLDNETSERFPVFEEICKFLSLEGYFDAEKFSSLMNEHIEEIRGRYADAELFKSHGEIWISEYLTEIIGYLDNKGMTGVCPELFHVALGEAQNAGI